MRKTILFTFILLLVQWCYGEALLPAAYRQQLEKTMQTASLDTLDFNFLKDWSNSTGFKLPRILGFLEKPLQLPDYTDSCSTLIKQQDLLAIQQFCAKEISPSYRPEDIDKDLWNTRAMFAVSKPKKMIKYVQQLYGTAYPYYKTAFSSLTSEELIQIQSFAWNILLEEEDSKAYQEFFKEKGIKSVALPSTDSLLVVLQKVNLPALLHGADILQCGWQALLDQREQIKFSLSSPYEVETQWGKMVIGSKKSDQYSGRYAFIMDCSGNDIYNLANQTNTQYPFSMIIDMSGNDQYNAQTIGGLQSALMGYSFLFDATGNDTYRGKDWTGSAFWGVQHWVDLAGDDIYEGGYFSLGAAGFGISTLWDQSGNDTYRVTACGEAFGTIAGYGLLCDMEGHDSYYAGGKYLHAPLAPLDHRTMSQGFGFGIRPDLGGGFGCLFDGSGNDTYQCGVYGQGVAYWYAVGMLIDEDGNDFYNAVYYPQGSGIHLATGILADKGGEDRYYSKHGPGQGAGHDYGVGFLIDKSGDDRYSVEGGNGLGLANSVGIFIDGNGNDRYEGDFPKNYGYGEPSRDSGSIGVFLDLAGKDIYPSGKKDDSTWQSGSFGVGADINSDYTPKTPVAEIAEQTATEIDSTASIATIFAIASEWEVGSSVKRVRRARELLLSREKEASDYIWQSKMDSKSGLEYRVITEFAKASPIYRSRISEGLQAADTLVVKNTIAIIGELSDSTYTAQLKSFLDNRKFVTVCLGTLGDIKSAGSVSLLANWIHVPEEQFRVTAARGLRFINSQDSLAILRQMDKDPSYLVRCMIRLLPPPKRVTK